MTKGFRRRLQQRQLQQPQLRCWQRDLHTTGRQVESEPSRLGVQRDHDAVLILEIGDRAALADRDTGGICRIVAAQIRRIGQIVDLALGANAGAAYVGDRDSRELELVLLLVFAVVKRAVTPGVSDPEGDRTAAEPPITRRY